MNLVKIDRAAPRQRISDRVHDQLESAIRDLRIEPGAALSETELSAQLGVSRTPVREAISRLVDQKLVTVAAQVGTTVSKIDMAAVEEACFVRSALETAAFIRACNKPARSISKLRRLIDNQERSAQEDDSDTFLALDDELHQEIFRLAGFPTVWSLVRGSKVQLDRVRKLVVQDSALRDSVLHDHSRLVDLLEAGDVTEGSTWVEFHAFRILDLTSQVRATHPGYFA